MILGDPRTIISHGNNDIFPFSSCTDLQGTTHLHGLNSIERKIEQKPVQFIFISRDLRYVRTQLQIKLNILAVEINRKQRTCFPDDIINVCL